MEFEILFLLCRHWNNRLHGNKQCKWSKQNEILYAVMQNNPSKFTWVITFWKLQMFKTSFLFHDIAKCGKFQMRIVTITYVACYHIVMSKVLSNQCQVHTFYLIRLFIFYFSLAKMLRRKWKRGTTTNPTLYKHIGK